MRKLIALILALMLLASLTACGSNSNNADTTPQTTVGDQQTPEDTTQTPETQNNGGEEEGVYSYNFDGTELIPGAVLDTAALPEADSVYQVPSCAIEGTDNVYNYVTFELTAYDDGTGEVIYSIYLIDANTPTTEGLYLGDDLAMVEELYGTGYTANGNELTYQKGETLLIIILDNGYVSSIEYRMN